jgi:hypothetical protein
MKVTVSPPLGLVHLLVLVPACACSTEELNVDVDMLVYVRRRRKLSLLATVQRYGQGGGRATLLSTAAPTGPWGARCSEGCHRMATAREGNAKKSASVSHDELMLAVPNRTGTGMLCRCCGHLVHLPESTHTAQRQLLAVKQLKRKNKKKVGRHNAHISDALAVDSGQVPAGGMTRMRALASSGLHQSEEDSENEIVTGEASSASRSIRDQRKADIKGGMEGQDGQPDHLMMSPIVIYNRSPAPLADVPKAELHQHPLSPESSQEYSYMDFLEREHARSVQKTASEAKSSNSSIRPDEDGVGNQGRAAQGLVKAQGEEEAAIKRQTLLEVLREIEAGRAQERQRLQEKIALLETAQNVSVRQHEELRQQILSLSLDNSRHVQRINELENTILEREDVASKNKGYKDDRERTKVEVSDLHPLHAQVHVSTTTSPVSVIHATPYRTVESPESQYHDRSLLESRGVQVGSGGTSNEPQLERLGVSWTLSRDREVSPSGVFPMDGTQQLWEVNDTQGEIQGGNLEPSIRRAADGWDADIMPTEQAHTPILPFERIARARTRVTSPSDEDPHWTRQDWRLRQSQRQRLNKVRGVLESWEQGAQHRLSRQSKLVSLGSVQEHDMSSPPAEHASTKLSRVKDGVLQQEGRVLESLGGSLAWSPPAAGEKLWHAADGTSFSHYLSEVDDQRQGEQAGFWENREMEDSLFALDYDTRELREKLSHVARKFGLRRTSQTILLDSGEPV